MRRRMQTAKPSEGFATRKKLHMHAHACAHTHPHMTSKAPAHMTSAFEQPTHAHARARTHTHAQIRNKKCIHCHTARAGARSKAPHSAKVVGFALLALGSRVYRNRRPSMPRDGSQDTTRETSHRAVPSLHSLVWGACIAKGVCARVRAGVFVCARAKPSSGFRVQGSGSRGSG
jgi:hypothetical protein